MQTKWPHHNNCIC